jgi:hypothetical protein
LQDVVLVGQIGERLIEPLRVLEERHQRADESTPTAALAPVVPAMTFKPPYQRISPSPIASMSSTPG